MTIERATTWVRPRPNHPRVVYLEGQWLDGITLDARIAELARHLRACSVHSGQLLACRTSSSWLIYLLLQATAELGAALYPIDPRLPEGHLQSLLEQSGADHLLRGDGAVGCDLDLNALTVTPLKGCNTDQPEPSALALLIATSGSSGQPKGVMLEWPSILKSAQTVNHQLNLGTADCWLNCLPLFHIGGLSILFRTALAGASMVLHQGFDPTQVWQDLQHHRVTHLSLVPAMLAQLLDHSSSPPPQWLGVALIGGAALEENLARRALAAGWPLFVTYGMSETGSQVATAALTSADAINQPTPLLEGIECAVVDDKGQPTRDTGHIRLRGELLMRGYANPRRLGGDGLDPAGWYTSGDLGHYDHVAGITILGRADEIIISGGEKVHPRQVEQLLQPCPGIDELCVTGVADPVWGEILCAVYSGEITEQALEQWCRQEVTGPPRPRDYLRLSQLPRLANNKIDLPTVKQLVRSRR